MHIYIHMHIHMHTQTRMHINIHILIPTNFVPVDDLSINCPSNTESANNPVQSLSVGHRIPHSEDYTA